MHGVAALRPPAADAHLRAALLRADLRGLRGRVGAVLVDLTIAAHRLQRPRGGLAVAACRAERGGWESAAHSRRPYLLAMLQRSGLSATPWPRLEDTPSERFLEYCSEYPFV